MKTEVTKEMHNKIVRAAKSRACNLDLDEREELFAQREFYLGAMTMIYILNGNQGDVELSADALSCMLNGELICELG